MTAKLIEVALGVLFSQRRVWLQPRKEAGPLDGLWEFPGGKILPGETPLAAVIREVKEETGLQLAGTVPQLIEIIDHRYPDREVRLHFFACLLRQPFRLETGIWVDLKALGNYPQPEANQSILKRLKTWSAD